MKITEVGKSRKFTIPKGKTVCVTVDEGFDDYSGVIVTSGTPYPVEGFLVSDPKFVVAGNEAHSICLGKGSPSLFLEIGKKVDLWLRTSSNQDEFVFVQEFK